MKTILDAEVDALEAERDFLEADLRIGRAIRPYLYATMALAFLGLILNFVVPIIGVIVSLSAAGIAALLLGGKALRVSALERGRPREAREELNSVLARWMESYGYEPRDWPTTLEDLRFPIGKSRKEEATYGSAELVQWPEGVVVPVVLKVEPGKGYVIHGPDGELFSEYEYYRKNEGRLS